MSLVVSAICAGKAIPFRDGESSAIAKRELAGPVTFHVLGIAGDQQADQVHHGGPEMAVHHYPLDHHAYWRDELGNHALLDDPGAFGSNLAVSGMTEGDVLLGARYRLGSVLLEACQPRKPCWKIEHRFGEKGMVKRILATGRCGWFYLVLEGGTAQAGDRLELVEEGLPGWTMQRLFDGIWGTSTPTSSEGLREIAGLHRLADTLRGKIEGMIAQRGS